MRNQTRGQMQIQGDFSMSEMPIWGNACTVSFEPYLEQQVAPNDEFSWTLTYHV